jgi:hypothetical protein
VTIPVRYVDDIWKHLDEYDALCITINGFVTQNFEAVMGRGIALQACERFPDLKKYVGQKLLEKDPESPLVDYSEWSKDCNFITFQVKPASVIAAADLSNVVKHWRSKVRPNGYVPGFAAIANKELIVKSCLSLYSLIESLSYVTIKNDGITPLLSRRRIALPKPGCGAGELSWEEIEPLIEPLLHPYVEIIDRRT